VTSPTHDHSGILDIVATRADLAAPDVSVLEAGISDHRLLRWTCHLERPPPVYHTSMYRSWRRVNVDEFKAALRESAVSIDSVADIDRAGDDALVRTSIHSFVSVHGAVAILTSLLSSAHTSETCSPGAHQLKNKVHHSDDFGVLLMS